MTGPGVSSSWIIRFLAVAFALVPLGLAFCDGSPTRYGWLYDSGLPHDTTDGHASADTQRIDGVSQPKDATLGLDGVSVDGSPLADAVSPSDSVPKPLTDSTIDKAPPPTADQTIDQTEPDLLVPADLGTVTYSGTFPSGNGEKTANLTVAGKSRQVSLYLPANRGTNPPLLIALHGSGGTGNGAIWDSSAITLANNEGVVIAGPQARQMTKGDWDNHGAGEVYWETHPNTDPNSNPDLLLIRAVIEAASQAYNIDLKRVYVIGFSNGGFFSIAVAMTLNNSVAAFAENASGLVRCSNTYSCSFKGSGTSCQSLAGQSGYCSCSGTEKPSTIVTAGRKPPGLLYHAANDGTVSVYYTCALAERMQQLGYTVSVKIRSSGGHSWPSNFATTAWAFLSQYTLP